LTSFPGLYTVSGTDVSFPRIYILVPLAGSYLLSGTDVDLSATSPFVLDVGSYSSSGTNPDLFYNRQLQTDVASYVIGGSVVVLTTAAAFFDPVIVLPIFYSFNNLTPISYSYSPALISVPYRVDTSIPVRWSI
jgi:hypothetical protein